MVVVFASVFLVFAVFLCWVAWQCVEKEKWGYLSLLIPCITILAIAWHPSIIGFIKTELVQILSTKTFELGKKLDDTLKTVSEVQKDLEAQKDRFQNELSKQKESIERQQTLIIRQQSDISIQQKQAKDTQESLASQEDKLTKQQKDIDSAHQELKKAYARLDEHQKRLSNIDFLTKNIFKQFRTETFQYPDKDRLFISHKEGATRDAIVLFKLERIPIPETIELQWHHTRQSPNSFSIHDNFVWSFWNDSVSRAKDKPWAIKYVADPTAKNAPTNFTLIDGKCKFNNIEFEELTMRVDGKKVSTFFSKRDNKGED